MKRVQRKARLKAIKAAQKAQRKASRDNVPANPAPLESAAPAIDAPESAPDTAQVARDLADECVAAKGDLDQARFLTTERARELLSDAAESLHRLVKLATRTLQHVQPEQLAEALDITRSKPEPQTGTAQQRPRRASNPVVTLMQFVIRAQSLIKRIVLVTNPELKQRKAA